MSDGDTSDRVYTHEELFTAMEQDELEDSPLVQLGRMTPRLYAKMRGKEPQIIYYYLRTQRLKLYYCDCGRKVIDVAEADALLEAQEAKHKRKGQ